jgi:hypothetical protein
MPVDPGTSQQPDGELQFNRRETPQDTLYSPDCK